MRLAYLSAALCACLGAAALADTVPPTKGFSVFQQSLERAAASLPRTVAGRRRAASDASLRTPRAADGLRDRFSCAQIRAMDEVELITDDSYCD
jgi:hypothetical protein